MKRLIICCDGTWNRADQVANGEPCPTNVVKLAYRVAKRDTMGVPQIVYYDHGVGTGNTIDRMTGGAFGRGLEENIHDAYRFLIANYEKGDEIFLFGFSRGAFTARSLAGMVRNCGILKREAVAEYRNAIGLYRDRASDPNHENSRRFRGSFSICGDESVKIRMIGVWDTVGALGIPIQALGLRRMTRSRHQFHDTELSSSVEYGFHALAIDERRGAFKPTLWADAPKDHTVEQVWFAGVHSDIGGGYPVAGLSDIALQWMMKKASQVAGLAFADFPGHPLHPEPRADRHVSRKGIYRLAPSYNRPIGLRVDLKGNRTDQHDSTQRVHDSVLERWEADPGYRPPQLMEYFQRIGDPLVTDREPVPTP